VGYAIVVGIYVLLSLLCYWGALEWESWFMFAIGTVWMTVAVVCLLWFMLVPPREA
jgi:hypothetical protein